MTYYYTPMQNALPVGVNGSELFLESRPWPAAMGDFMIGAPVSGDDLITGDGTTRPVIVVNGQLPGPTIEVMEGSQVRNYFRV